MKKFNSSETVAIKNSLSEEDLDILAQIGLDLIQNDKIALIEYATQKILEHSFEGNSLDDYFPNLDIREIERKNNNGSENNI